MHPVQIVQYVTRRRSYILRTERTIDQAAQYRNNLSSLWDSTLQGALYLKQCAKHKRKGAPAAQSCNILKSRCDDPPPQTALFPAHKSKATE